MPQFNIIENCKDGTIKFKNIFAGTEAWFTPGRQFRPIMADYHKRPKKIKQVDIPNYCSFCPANYLETTPEKSRFFIEQGKWVFRDLPDPDEIFEKIAQVRRISNLYEIISIEYWKQNYGYKLSEKSRQRKEQYLSSQVGRKHILSLIDRRLDREGLSGEEINDIPISKKIEMADSFFGGGHELIIPMNHYRNGAIIDTELCSAGLLTPDEHFYYFILSIHALKDIRASMPFLKFICVYTNWQRDAGASFEHLHRQVLALDRWGTYIERAIELTQQDNNLFNKYINFLAVKNNLILCENDYAIAFVDLGHPFTTLSIYSKCSHCRPYEHNPQEIRGISDIVHAMHAALGEDAACNEEWYYQPFDSNVRIPWHLLIKWRKNRHAGIEGITKLYVDVANPHEIKKMIVDRLTRLRRDNQIAGFNIGDECSVGAETLGYFKRLQP